MTTAHRPTFDPARGKEAARGPAYHQRLLPAHTVLKHRLPGQGGVADARPRDLRAELLAAEAAYYAKKNGTPLQDNDSAETSTSDSNSLKRPHAEIKETEEEDEEQEAKRRRQILEKYHEIDADDSDSSESSSDEEDDEDETDLLMRELEKIKKERAEKKAKEEAERAAQEEEQREYDIARGNPLLNPKDFNIKRRWDDDVVFKNQARGTETKKPKEFVNDMLRSDFHKRFMSKYVR